MTTTSIGTRLGLRKLTARIGAEVTGVSPSLELDPETDTPVVHGGRVNSPAHAVT